MVEHSVLGDEKNKKQPHERKILIAILSVLAVLIVGLVVTVIANVISSDDEESDIVQAINKCNEINGLYEETLDYELVASEFESGLSGGVDLRRMYLSICYAKFINDNGGSLEDAVEKLGSFQSVADSEGGDVAIDYYVAMRDLYEFAGRDDEVEYYDGVIEELMPKDTRPIEEINGGAL